VAFLEFETRGNSGSRGDSDYVGVVLFGSNVPTSNVSQPQGGYGGGTWGGGNVPGGKLF
jgi:hypothetical protein